MKNYTSIPSAFFETVHKMPQSPAYRYRDNNEEKVTITYKKLYDKVNAIAKAFDVKGLSKKHVAIFSENRIEWFISDMALLALGSADVPRGIDSTSDELNYIIEHSEAQAVLVENEYVFKKIEKHHKDLSLIVFLDSSKHDPDNNIYSFEKFLELGEESLNGDEEFAIKKASKLTNESTATIIYTSGTTGKPKGVILTHGNILHNVRVLPDIIKLQPGEKLLTILPIWHIYERTISYVTAITGCFTAITNKRYLKNDFTEERPDIFISVPAIWVNIYNTVMKNIDRKSTFARNLAKFLIKRSIKYIRSVRFQNDLVYLLGDEHKSDKKSEYSIGMFDPIYHKMATKMVYSKIKELTGGKMRLTISGGGALPMYIEDFIEAVGINLVVGWGITETAPVVTLRSPFKNYRGTCGAPVPEVKIEVRDKEGNICEDGVMGVCYIKGPNIFKEYYKDPELTKQAKVDGFFNSGDLGTYTQQGEIVLTGRAKETIVLLTGENVEPQPIENKALESPYISQIMLVGQDKASTGAIIVINKENIKEHFDKQKIHYDEKTLASSKDVYKLMREELDNLINYKNGFRPYEAIAKMIITDEEFTIENGLLTQSLKIKRANVMEAYKDKIDALYDKVK
ncbi:long-chain fatty acid--CoA ligase [uncultured Brachyspira sp.]|uniref:AMP-dependent synthetase/ligase n=1 Tax=uncultured Brachyspira sp. TaxID=221953 RepID=UPI0026266EE5|nr:AMP-binding protein [uncultured Brachyspira sp.]